MSQLSNQIKAFFTASDAEVGEIEKCFKPLSLSKNEYFIKEGRYTHKLGFIESGIIREYLIVDGKEITKWLSVSGYFAVDIAGFLFDRPARWNFQALTDCHMQVIDQRDYHELHRVIPAWTLMEKNFLARCFTVLEDRVVSHLSLNAEERYKLFFQAYPELFNQVPLQYLASLLGMTPETLSRIRSRQNS